MTLKTCATLVLATVLAASPAIAQRHNVRLHINTRWKQCSFQLDSALTQSAWHQFTAEAGVVGYFRPLIDAEPMGRGRFEFSVHQWSTRIDDTDAAWNDTFVHPDSTHWLFEGNSLSFPGVTARLGVARRTDVGIYFTKNVEANYGFYGAQLQQNVVHDTTRNWSAAARVSFVSLFGPDDLDFTVYGLDFVTSRSYTVFSRRLFLAPYAGVSATLSRSHEKTAVVDLENESVWGAQGMLGVAANFSVASLGIEYAIARVQSLSLKVGFGHPR